MPALVKLKFEQAMETNLGRHGGIGQPQGIAPTSIKIFYIFWVFYSWGSYFVAVPKQKRQEGLKIFRSEHLLFIPNDLKKATKNFITSNI